MLPDGATDMTGSTIAAILILPAGTIFLAAWLAVVFDAGRDHPRGPATLPAGQSRTRNDYRRRHARRNRRRPDRRRKPCTGTPGAVPECKVVQGVSADRLSLRDVRQGEADRLGRQVDVFRCTPH
jgi:hypothetical protein